MKIIIIFTILWAFWAWSKEAQDYEDKIIIERGYFKYLETYKTD